MGVKAADWKCLNESVAKVIHHSVKVERNVIIFTKVVVQSGSTSHLLAPVMG